MERIISFMQTTLLIHATSDEGYLIVKQSHSLFIGIIGFL